MNFINNNNCVHKHLSRHHFLLIIQSKLFFKYFLNNYSKFSKNFFKLDQKISVQ